MEPARRISVVGNSGSGKSTLAKLLARRLSVPRLELDALAHLPNWSSPAPEDFARQVRDFCAGDAWVVDGNYRAVQPLVWERAELVLWLALPRLQVLRQLVARTVRRALTREVLWNGNRERLENFTSWDPERSVIAWAWTEHAAYEARYSADLRSPPVEGLRFLRLRSHAESARVVEELAAALR